MDKNDNEKAELQKAVVAEIAGIDWETAMFPIGVRVQRRTTKAEWTELDAYDLAMLSKVLRSRTMQLIDGRGEPRALGPAPVEVSRSLRHLADWCDGAAKWLSKREGV